MKPLLISIATLLAATAGPAVSLAQSTAAPPDETLLYAPTFVPWIHTVILAITWLFVAAILLGPVVMYFQRQPPTPTRRRAMR